MKDLKEIYVNETNLQLDGNIVKGGILPSKIAELTRSITIQNDSVIDGPVFASRIEIKNGTAIIKGALFAQQELYINSDAAGEITFEKCVASSNSVVSHSNNCKLTFMSDVNAKSIALKNAFVSGSIYADEVSLENCVVIGGVFATLEASFTNCVLGTFNSPIVHLDGIINLLLPTAFSVEKAIYTPNTQMFNLSIADLGSLYRGDSQDPYSGKIEMNLENDDLRTTLVDKDNQRSLHSYTVVGKVLAVDLLDVDKFQNHFLLTAAALGPQLLKTYDLGVGANGESAVLSFEKIRQFFFDILLGQIEIKTIDGTFNINEFCR